MSELNAFLEQCRQPEYLHILLNPIPIYGVAVGIVSLIFALIARSRSAQVVSLLIIAGTAAIAWPVADYGEQSYDRAQSISDRVGEQWLGLHEQRAQKFVKVYYVLVFVALNAAILPWKFPKWNLPLCSFTLIASIVVLLVGMWIAHPGGQIRHKEFRVVAPPESHS
jgi:hypothetical protein